MIGTHIRRAIPSEALLLTELTLRSKAHWGYDDDFMARARPVMTISPEMIERWHYYVLEENDRIRGYYSLEAPHENDIILENLFVALDAIGMGYGKHLLLHALNTAVQLGYEIVTLESDPNAENFYRHMGAQRIGQRPSAILEGRMLPLMRFTVKRDAAQHPHSPH